MGRLSWPDVCYHSKMIIWSIDLLFHFPVTTPGKDMAAMNDDVLVIQPIAIIWPS